MLMPPTVTLSVLVLTTFTSTLSNGKILEGELATSENWAFLTRFCFLAEKGRFSFHVEFPTEYEVQRILLYYDARSQWPAVYKKPKSCLEKESVLNPKRHQFINLTSTGPEKIMGNCYQVIKVEKQDLPSSQQQQQPSSSSDQQSFSNDSTSAQVTSNRIKWTVCDSFREFGSARERWWFVAISNCDSTKGLRLKYRFELINEAGSSWLRHFSADQFYILHTDVIFTVLYYLLFVASAITARILESRNLLHETYKLFMVSVLVESAGLTLLTTYYAMFAQYGTASESIKFIGRSFESISSVTLLLLLILLAKGYTVTRARLPGKTSLKIGIFMGMYTIIYAALLTWERSVFDPGEVLYIYESPAGYGLIILRLVGWVWFVYSVVRTLMHYPSKSNFFTRLFLVYTLWFVSSPVVVLVSTLAVPKWVREKVLNGVELTIAFQAHLVFYILTQPSSNNFPFHVRTTQIDVMNKEGDGSLDRFTNYPYAPSVPAIVDTSLERGNMAFTTYNSHPQLMTTASMGDFPKRNIQNSFPPGLNHSVDH